MELKYNLSEKIDLLFYFEWLVAIIQRVQDNVSNYNDDPKDSEDGD